MNTTIKFTEEELQEALLLLRKRKEKLTKTAKVYHISKPNRLKQIISQLETSHIFRHAYKAKILTIANHLLEGFSPSTAYTMWYIKAIKHRTLSPTIKMYASLIVTMLTLKKFKHHNDFLSSLLDYVNRCGTITNSQKRLVLNIIKEGKENGPIAKITS